MVAGTGHALLAKIQVMKTPRGYKRILPKDIKATEAEVKRLLKILKEERKKQGYTQESFAEKLDLSVAYVTALERGYRLPSLPHLVRIARVLGITFEPHKK